MKSKFRLVLITAALGSSFLLHQTQVDADVIDDAYILCSALERTGLTSECEVKGWGSTVDARIATSSSEASDICASVANMMAQKTRNFDGKWKLRIFSPYSGDHPIAVCTLL